MANWSRHEILKVVFPLLDGKDLVSCMLVCRQWREIAKDDYLWKCICARKWPSICQRPPHAVNYHKLFGILSRPRQTRSLPIPRLVFDDLMFYIDMWSDHTLIFSQAVLCSALRLGMKVTPHGITDNLREHLKSPECKMLLQVEPSLRISLIPAVTVSVFAWRKDSNKMACIINNSTFDYIDSSASRALAYEYLRFSPRHPFISDIRAWASLLFVDRGDNAHEVFAIEIDFCDAATSETEVLWLLDTLDWK